MYSDLIMTKRLLQINITANWGSHGRIAEEIGRIAISNNWESFIAYGRNANPSMSHLVKIGHMFDEMCHGVQSRLLDQHGLASKHVTRAFISEIERIKPDIIHLHNIHGYYLNYPILFDFLSSLSVPVVWTLHDCWPITGHCAYPSSFACDLWKDGCHDCPARTEYPKSLLIDNSRENYRLKKKYFCGVDSLHIVTVSKWLENEVRASFLKGYDIRCIYNGVDIDVFSPQKSTDSLREKHHIGPNEKVALGVASVWEKRKGLEDFYQLRQVLSSDYRIILIGLDKSLTRQVPEGIDIVMRTDNQAQLAAYYSMADVFVNPSQAETFGLTTAEALACGTPCVVYDTSACPELISEETGRVVPLNDISAMAEAIRQICEKTDQTSMGNACRERAVKLFNKSERYQEYWKLYQSILDK